MITHNVPAQEDGGATILEISQQPDAWREVAANLGGAAHEFLAPLLSLPDLRIVLTGAGSSAFIGEIAASALRRHLGRRVEAIATTDIVAKPLDHVERATPTLLVSFARSGNSPESVATTALVDSLADNVWHLVLTCDPSGALGGAHEGRTDSFVVCMPERTNDTGFAMTSSLTSMLLACLLLMGPAETCDAAALADAAQYMLEQHDDIRELARRKKHRIVYLGSGSLQAVARESALKLLELTAGEVDTYFDSPLGFRHGPKSVLDLDTLVVVFVSTDPHARQYDLDIVAEIRGQLGPDALIAISAVPIPQSHGPVVVVPGLANLDDAAVALPYLLFAQYLALFSSVEYGKTPDNPFPSGEVNRVVHGVTIYPNAR